MKLKQDFITNSSSASYLTFIPDGFDVDKFIKLIPEYKIEELLDTENYYGNEQYKDKQSLLDAVKKGFDSLINTGTVSYWDDEVFWIIQDILEKLDLIIDEPETGGGDGSGAIININGADNKSKLKTILEGGWGLKHGGWGIETKI